MSQRGFKNAECQAHLHRPGFKFGSRACSCRRRGGHAGPHRAAGRFEWVQDGTLQKVTDIKTGEEFWLP